MRARALAARAGRPRGVRHAQRVRGHVGALRPSRREGVVHGRQVGHAGRERGAVVAIAFRSVGERLRHFRVAWAGLVPRHGLGHQVHHHLGRHGLGGAVRLGDRGAARGLQQVAHLPHVLLVHEDKRVFVHAEVLQRRDAKEAGGHLLEQCDREGIAQHGRLRVQGRVDLRRLLACPHLRHNLHNHAHLAEHELSARLRVQLLDVHQVLGPHAEPGYKRRRHIVEQGAVGAVVVLVRQDVRHLRNDDHLGFRHALVVPKAGDGGRPQAADYDFEHGEVLELVHVLGNINPLDDGTLHTR
mmetsp:Transcript_25490/g.63972  ORF Transcript_25490/g.63972 Transcript_25490/m.63972 type:complete len:299 (+) Transcript_25490:519-1415(+)